MFVFNDLDHSINWHRLKIRELDDRIIPLFKRRIELQNNLFRLIKKKRIEKEGGTE